MFESIDQLGRSIAFKNHPKRIVSLVPSQTELLYYLGLEVEVVGITKFCVHPNDWFRNKTRIGGTKNVNIKAPYIGHSSNFTKRKNCHKSRCNNDKDEKHYLKVYVFIRANEGWDNFEMVLIENFPCETELEALTRERELYEQFDAKLNTQVPNRSQAEYYVDNKKKIIEKQKQYNIVNAEKIKKYKNDNKDKINKKRRERYQKKKQEKLNLKLTSNDTVENV